MGPCSYLWKWARRHRLSAVLRRYLPDIPSVVTGLALFVLIALLFEPSTEMLRVICVLLMAAVISVIYWREDRASNRR